MSQNAPERVTLPTPQGVLETTVREYLVFLVKQLVGVFSLVSLRANATLPKDGAEAMLNPLPLKSFTVATLPAASAWTGAVVFVSDGGAGAVFRGSDGTSWVSLG